MRKPLITAALLAAAAAVAFSRIRSAAAAQTPSPQTSAQDHAFAEKAALSGLAEVALGRLALDRGQSSTVKDLAQMLVDGHSAANAQLSQIGLDQNIGLPPAIDEARRQQAQTLARLHGAEFDRSFIEAIIHEHESDIDLYRAEAETGTIMPLRAFAQATLPILQQHLDAARQAAASLR